MQCKLPGIQIQTIATYRPQSIQEWNSLKDVFGEDVVKEYKMQQESNGEGVYRIQRPNSKRS